MLDLIWINDNVYNWHGAHVIYDIISPLKDHRTLLIQCGDQSSATLDNQHLVQSYIPSRSEEEEHLIFQADMAKWSHEDPTIHAQQMITSFLEAWDKYAKPGLMQYNHWWSEDCQNAKQAYNQRPTQSS